MARKTLNNRCDICKIPPLLTAIKGLERKALNPNHCCSAVISMGDCTEQFAHLDKHADIQIKWK